MTSENTLREALLASSKAGHLLRTIYERSTTNWEGRDDLVRELAALHNDGSLDLIVAYDDLKNHESGGPDFFLTRYVFEEVLPNLNAPIEHVMHCVLKLCREAFPRHFRQAARQRRGSIRFRRLWRYL